MKKRKLNYRFHNPNTAEVTADYLLKILIEAITIDKSVNNTPTTVNLTGILLEG